MQYESPRCVVVLTALPVELRAVLDHASLVRKQTNRPGTIYRIGAFVGQSGRWKVIAAQIGAGNPGAAEEVVRAIGSFRPGVVLFVGVAGGLKDELKLGDVVASTKVYAYESGKEDKVFWPRPEVANPGYDLEQRALDVNLDDHWQNRIRPQPPRCGRPTAFVKPIAAGEKVVASRRSSAFGLIRRQYSDAYAVEMEGYGFLRAAQAYPGVSAMVIRGISDLIESKRESDNLGWQDTASRHAAAFAFELLGGLQHFHTHDDPLWFFTNGAQPSNFQRQTEVFVQLAKTPSDAWDIEDYLIRTLECRPPTERYWTYITVGEIGGNDGGEAEIALRKGLSDPNEFARKGAKEGLELLRKRGGTTHA